MAELLALRSCTSSFVSSYEKSSESIGGRQSRIIALGWSKSPEPPLVLIRRQKRRMLKFPGKGCSGVRAGLRDTNGKNDPSSMSTSEDWQYLGKFFAACTGGAVLIKYGSILVPNITQPNLVQALIMISTPVLVSLVVLLAASSEKKADK